MKTGEIIGRRMTARMKELDLSVAELGRRIGLDTSDLPRLYKIKQGKVDNPRGDLPVKIAKALGISISDLRGDQSSQIPTQSVRVVGEVAAGVWRESGLFSSGGTEEDVVPVVPGRYASVPQFAVRVSGSSINKVIPDGYYAVCVPYWEVRAAMTDGDLVVVERKRADLVEGTIKRLRKNGRWELWPESDDPRYQEPIPVEPPDGSPEVEVEIKGLVIWKGAPV